MKKSEACSCLTLHFRRYGSRCTVTQTPLSSWARPLGTLESQPCKIYNSQYSYIHIPLIGRILCGPMTVAFRHCGYRGRRSLCFRRRRGQRMRRYSCCKKQSSDRNRGSGGGSHFASLAGRTRIRFEGTAKRSEMKIESWRYTKGRGRNISIAKREE